MRGAFLAGGILTTLGLIGHCYTMEHWIYPKLKDEGFPSTPFGDSVQMKKSFRMLWHFYTIDFITTAALDFIFYFTNWFKDPTPIARILAAQWFAWMFICLWIAEFDRRQLTKAFQWLLIFAIGTLTFLGTV